MKPSIESSRLLLFAASPTMAPRVLDYHVRNKEFLAPFEPSRPDLFYTLEYHIQNAQEKEAQAKARSGFQFYVVPKVRPELVIGAVALNQVVWGCFESCFLGYGLDKDHIGNGFMTEAVLVCTRYAFEVLGLHRIEANVMPGNTASLRVLKKCGYENEGLAKKYLKINGVWEDHIHMVKIRDSLPVLSPETPVSSPESPS